MKTSRLSLISTGAISLVVAGVVFAYFAIYLPVKKDTSSLGGSVEIFGFYAGEDYLSACSRLEGFKKEKAYVPQLPSARAQRDTYHYLKKGVWRVGLKAWPYTQIITFKDERVENDEVIFENVANLELLLGKVKSTIVEQGVSNAEFKVDDSPIHQGDLVTSFEDYEIRIRQGTESLYIQSALKDKSGLTQVSINGFESLRFGESKETTLSKLPFGLKPSDGKSYDTEKAGSLEAIVFSVNDAGAIPEWLQSSHTRESNSLDVLLRFSHGILGEITFYRAATKANPHGLSARKLFDKLSDQYGCEPKVYDDMPDRYSFVWRDEAGNDATVSIDMSIPVVLTFSSPDLWAEYNRSFLK